MTSSVSPSTTTTPTTASKTAASSDQETSVLTSDFNTFLKMLTAQARNQDPLEPLDSTQYASQLAQFSMVEQQVKTNDSLNLLSGQFGVSNMAALASWVGMEARAATTAYFDGSALTLSPS
ncbi:MAG: flagellar hook assembly protein FlgD, partial [Planctomycetes bacterium]|nr:flagellar hook assembly protein FlgD [Planctomycetota bacterium]